MKQAADNAAEVRGQHEALPYPPWKRGDEDARLVRTWLDDLPMVNHYCFAGRQTFRDGFRVLVAGGGTGDATIFLAEQLRATDAQIVHLDTSEARLAIAREQAEVRALSNIAFVRGSLLELPALALGTFDYINCAGVLHHLDDPDAGLTALRSALDGDGALGLMLNATLGRIGVHQLQALLHLLCEPSDSLETRVGIARQILATLPRTNWFKRTESLHRDHIASGDAGVADLLLHARDRSYTIDEIYGWVTDRHGLHIELTGVQRGRSAYEPALTLGPEHERLIGEIAAMPERRRHAIGELFSGSLTVHTFYATRSPACRAPYGDPRHVPFFFHEPVTGPELAELVRKHQDRPFLLAHQHTGVRALVDPGRFGRLVLRNIDGQRTFGEIFSAVRAELPSGTPALSDADLFADFRAFHDVLASIDRLLLRHRDAAQKE